MSVMASHVTGVSFVCSVVCSGADQRKHQSSASLAFVRGIHRSPVNSPHKGPVTRKMFPFDDVIMFNLQNTPDISPVRTRYGMSFVSMDRVITGINYIVWVLLSFIWNTYTSIVILSFKTVYSMQYITKFRMPSFVSLSWFRFILKLKIQT